MIRWVNDGENVFTHARETGHHSQDYDSSLKFKPNISWSDITSGAPSFRYRNHELSDHKGMPFFPKTRSLNFYIGLLNSSVVKSLLTFLSPTLSLNIGELERIPVVGLEDCVVAAVEIISCDCISVSKSDWDSFETSWDFKRHPLV